AGHVLRVLESEAFDVGLVGVKPGGGPLDKGPVLESRSDDFPADGVGQDDVRAHVEPKPDVRPTRRIAAAWIDDPKPGALVDCLEYVVKEDGMGLTRVRPPEQDEVRILDLAIGTSCTTRTKNRRQTDDAGGVSSTVATVDVVGANDHPSEFPGQEIQFVRGLRATEYAESLRAVFLQRAAKAGGGAVKGFFPACGPQMAIFTNQWSSKSGFAGTCHRMLPPSCFLRALRRGERRSPQGRTPFGPTMRVWLRRQAAP